MKTYILTEGELTELATLRWTATGAFAVASALFGFWLSVTQGIAFSENLTETVRASWDAWKWAALIGAVLSALLGGILTWRGHCRLTDIKSEMEHNA